MRRKFLWLWLILISVSAFANENSFLAVEYFSPVLDAQPRSQFPATVTLEDLNETVSEKQFSDEILSGIWVVGHTCSGARISVNDLLGKDIYAGQSERRPMLVVKFAEGEYTVMNGGKFTGRVPPHEVQLPELQKCSFEAKKTAGNTHLITCRNEERRVMPIRLTPVILRETGEMVLRTNPLADTPYVCPEGTLLYGIYSRVPTS